MNNGKYDYQFALTEHAVQQGGSSHAKILQQVRPSSMVLECGPADGVMTRYLKEILHCTVYILELDADCYAHASNWADGGCCANLEDSDWMDSLPDGAFDYILYADVLEHLRDPQVVLAKMKRFLKPDGVVLLSVPNVANGDIIANLLCDQFTYTPLGLLDNTHIHLFARKSLHDMIRTAGYYLAQESCTRVPLFATEQGAFLSETQRELAQQALLWHPTHGVYQYICRLSQTETETASDVDVAIGAGEYAAESRFYFDQGQGLSEERRVNIRPEPLSNGRLRYVVELPRECIAVRYDPVEYQRCILREITAMADELSVAVQPINGLTVGGSIFFAGEDPQVSIVPPAGTQRLMVETTLVVLGADNWNEAEKLMLELKSVLARETKKLEAERAAHGQTAQTLEAERAAHGQTAQTLEAERAAHGQTVQTLEAERAAHGQTAQTLEAERAAHGQTAQKLAITETMLNSANRARIRAEDAVRKNAAQCELLGQLLSAKANELDALRSSRSWKITKPLRDMKQVFTPKDR